MPVSKHNQDYQREDFADFKKIIGNKFRLARMREELSQKEMGEKAGYKGNAICSMEQGRRLNIVTLFALCTALGYEIDITLRKKNMTKHNG